jgi:hypothetical protein
MQKGSVQEEWRYARRRCDCRRPKGLRLAQAESEGRWRAVDAGGGRGAGAGRALGGGRWAGAETGAGRRAARDAAVVPERAMGPGHLGREDHWQP